MPNASCQVSRSLDFWFWRRRCFKVFTIYRHGGNLGYVTCTIFINFLSEGGSTWNLKLIDQLVSEKKIIENNSYIDLYSPGTVVDSTLGKIVFINSIIQLVSSFAASCPPSNDFVTVFPYSNIQVTQLNLAVKMHKVNPGSSLI